MRRFTSGFVSIDFLVDTGATDSLIHPQDAKIKIGIDSSLLGDPAQWPNHEPTDGVGGQATCYVEPAVFLFHHDNGQAARQITHEIRIVPPTATNDTLPSLLGMDILSQFKLTVDYVGLNLTLE